MGKQAMASIGCLLAFYVLSLPAGAILAFKFEMGLKGLWLGTMAGLTLLVLFYQYVITIRYDWRDICFEVQDRSQKNARKASLKTRLL